MKLNQRDALLEQNITLLFWFHVLITGLACSVPTIVLFLQESGLSMGQVLELQGLFSVGVLIGEVPSGYFADRWGRKRILVLGSILLLLGNLTYGLGSKFEQFLVAELLLAAGLSCISGADQALLFDSLLDLGRRKEYSRILGRFTFASAIGSAIIGISGGLLAIYSLRTPFFVGAGLLAGMCGVALRLTETERGTESMSSGPRVELLSQAFQSSLKRNWELWLFFGAFGMLTAIGQTSFWLSQSFYKLVGIPLGSFGVIFAVLNLINGATAHVSHVFEKRNTLTPWIFVGGFILLGISNLLIGLLEVQWAVGLFALHQIVRGAGGVLCSTFVNNRSNRKLRATLLSVSSAVSRAISSVMMLLMSAYIDTLGIGNGYITLGISAGIGAGLLATLIVVSSPSGKASCSSTPPLRKNGR